ncbi:hypothetical protein B0H14DRAFT_3480699 [Mycena olivaceomarginata]|nr:hypothetical protein B0H14DRAFT_3480699 [Mycena olivaceomarginata]
MSSGLQTPDPPLLFTLQYKTRVLGGRSIHRLPITSTSRPFSRSPFPAAAADPPLDPTAYFPQGTRLPNGPRAWKLRSVTLPVYRRALGRSLSARSPRDTAFQGDYGLVWMRRKSAVYALILVSLHRLSSEGSAVSRTRPHLVMTADPVV